MGCGSLNFELLYSTEVLCSDLPDLVAAAVLSGNRNFEGRVHPLTRANYLASPPLVVAYALAGTVCLRFPLNVFMLALFILHCHGYHFIDK